MDFPNVVDYHLPTISSWHPEAMGGFGMPIVAPTDSSAVWPAANRAIYVPFRIRTPYLVSRLFWCNGTVVAGNVDCGIYTADGTLLTSTGSTAQATVSVVQSVDITDIRLTPGLYYMALALSSGTATIYRLVATSVGVRHWAAGGMAQEASALPLPATMTPATIATDYLPIFGIAKATVI